MRQRPHLAALVAEVIARWALVEVQVGGMLARLIDSQHDLITDLYNSLNSFPLRTTFIEAAARRVLKKPYLDTFLAGLIYVRRTAAQRHKFAHGLWGFCWDIDNVLLLAEQKADILSSASYYKEKAESLKANPPTGPISLSRGGEFASVSVDDIMVYTERDIKDVVAMMDTAERIVGMMWLLIGITPGLVPSQTDVARDRVHNLLRIRPEIASILARMSRPTEDPQGLLPPPRHTSDVY